MIIYPEIKKIAGALRKIERLSATLAGKIDVVGVTKWEDLPGQYIRFEDNGWGSTITKIGNIIEDKWFDMREFFEEKKAK